MHGRDRHSVCYLSSAELRLGGVRRPRDFPVQNKAAIFQSRMAFTIVEVLVAVTVLALLGTAAIGGLLSINRIVVTNRLSTNAQALAQTQIDRILSEPYPAGSSAPADLTLGTATQTNVPIYRDPVSGVVIVAGTVTTTVTDASRTIIAGQPDAKLFRATVAVSYTFAGRPASLALTTIRAID